jgi:hypothetical protein
VLSLLICDLLDVFSPVEIDKSHRFKHGKNRAGSPDDEGRAIP